MEQEKKMSDEMKDGGKVHANVEFGESGAHFGTGLTLNNGTITALGNNAAFTAFRQAAILQGGAPPLGS